ncbi:MAG TPA: diphosphomevalonate decarboxylase [Polyangiaceae bacterium]|jgi:diphosphomevalonate decarboxylase|nr:diphosphomevalonate decarboxylase [Polyangiaceae bacterium]
MSQAVAAAHPNVALSKYWGKRPGGGKVPAVPSLSVTLAGLETRTRVAFDAAFAEDRFLLDGREGDPEARARVVELLDRVRAAAGETRRAEVRSANDFPTASGLASSASGFAALALAATRAAGLDWDAARVSDLARRSSASAARSVFGGFVELAAGTADGRDDAVFAARPVAGRDHLPLVILVCVTTEGRKTVGSSDGMARTMAASPFAAAWLDEAPRIHARLRDALLARDFGEVGRLAEASALAMHASAIAAGVTYWNGATLEVLGALRGLRAEGTPAFASIDAGPHVKVLARPEEAARVRAVVAAVPGVLRVLEARPGDGATLRDVPESARPDGGSA